MKLKYPTIEFIGKNKIEKGCKIICADGGRLIFSNSYLSFGTFIIVSKGGEIKITNTFIGRNCLIASKQNIQIGDGCEIAEMVVIRDQDHKHDLTSKKIALQGFTSSPIVIESNVWIGAKATILKGVTIGKDSVVGAHTLVNKSIPTSSLGVGIPVKIINKNG